MLEEYMVKQVRDMSRQLSYSTRPVTSYPWTDYTISISSYEISEGLFRSMPINTSSDDGGRWTLTRRIDQGQLGTVNGAKYKGNFTVNDTKPTYVASPPSLSQPSDTELNAAGTTAIARSAPNNPAFDMTVAIAEVVREGIPSMVGLNLWKERTQLARGAGSEYLNFQFGWKPLMSDIQSFARTVKDSHAILDSYRKGSDKKIRVGYSFPDYDWTDVYQGGGFFPWPSAYNQSGTGTLVRTQRTQRWFSGAFRYHIPTTDTVLGKFNNWLSMADRLLGVKVTPEDVWNLAPWSWAVDWFTNTGDVLRNVSNLGKDGLVLQYGYVMDHRRNSREYYCNFPGGFTSRIVLEEWKRRRQATPYGFGVDFSSLSARQVAIIAALGLSRT
jgi:hypothetical protein